MHRYNTRKAKASPQDIKFRPPAVVVRSSRRATLAGPTQLLSKQTISPVVILEGNVLGKINKGLLNAVKSQSMTRNIAETKKTGSKHSLMMTEAVKTLSKPKQVPSPRKTGSPVIRNIAETKKTGSKHSLMMTEAVKALSKPKQVPSPRKTGSPVKSSPKHSSPKQQKILSPKSNKESPSHSYSLRSTSFALLEPLHLDKSKSPSALKTVKVPHKHDRSMSPAHKKKPKVTAESEQRNKQQVSRAHTPQKPVRKRKRDTTINNDESHLSHHTKLLKRKSPSASKKSLEKQTGKRKLDVTRSKDESQLSPPPKKRILKTESHSASKKSPKKVTDTSFTEVRSKTVTDNLMKSKERKISVGDQYSTPVKPKLSENSVSMNWNMSSIKKRLIAGITPRGMKDSYDTPDNISQLKSALTSPEINYSGRKQVTHRRSVRFVTNGKADTVEILKQRSSHKRLVYRLCQYLLLLGIPAAVSVGSVLLYMGLI